MELIEAHDNLRQVTGQYDFTDEKEREFYEREMLLKISTNLLYQRKISLALENQPSI